MMFVFAEDGTLDVIADIEEARRKYEGKDVESGVFRFYDESGTYLRPKFSTPNKYWLLFRVFSWVQSGILELVPDPDADEDPVWLALYEASEVKPNSWFASIEDVKRFLESKGAIVEIPSS